ncbi:MAG: hypothetical protein IKY78_09200, partial [Clostridia bacterium]|nr:hypothetical protein [Clostridia bacterium]
SIICFIPVHFILEPEISLTASLIVARIGFGFVFIGANLIMQRLFGTAKRGAFSVALYMIITFIMSVPAVICAVAVLMLMAPVLSVEAAFLATVPANILVSAITLFFVRNILQYSEYNNK